jgi:apolipoprotein D and lipocalin family protein
MIIGTGLMMAQAGAARTPTPEVCAVPSVDLDRYAGTWYEIARLPNWFQKKCACCVTATYTVRGPGKLSVVNECRTADGRASRAEGVAKLADPKGPTSKLKVRFAPRILSFLGFVWGDYWVLDLADDYSYVLVGDPGRKYLWILARQPTLPEETYQALVQKAAAQGFAAERLERTRPAP